MQIKHAMAVVVAMCFGAAAHADLRDEALTAAKQATKFLHVQVSAEGGYLWRYSADLTKREGEGVVTTKTVWTQPPGTPSVGQAFVRLYEATGESVFRKAARDAAEALRLGQMRSGGWQDRVEFEPERRRKWAYRVDHGGRKDQSSLDDDKTQASLRFVMRLDRAIGFEDEVVHEMALYALDGLITKGQYPNGGFPQVWTGDPRDPADYSIKPASYPDSWSREYTGHHNYWYRYTLNDNLAPDVVEALFLAADIYGDPRYHDAALKVGDFLILAQMPDPQPAWAQQYGYDMHPIWARKFEPASITCGESQGVIKTLMMIYRRTGDRKYLAPIPKALDYLKRSELPDGRLARFYELRTNKPLYFTRDYKLTYDDSDMPTHYSFKISSKVDDLRRAYEKLVKLPADQLKQGGKHTPHLTDKLQQRVRQIIDAMDHRGAWVTDDGLRYHKQPGPVIDMRVAVRNLNVLAEYLAASKP
ncbi:pectic acid lyase [Planctomycetales bacterium ZRK34]|nr:pectic acid lyase [Planctomycetales bacterium ZRK34]